MVSTDESFSNTGYEPNNYFLTETHVESLTESTTEQRFPEQRFLEDVDYDDATIGEMLFNAHRVQVYHSQRGGLPAQIRTLLDRQREQILADCQAEIRRHEFQAKSDRRSVQNLVKRSSRNEKNFIGLKQKDFIDGINNFFMNSYRSKTGIYVKLMRKVSKKWKN